MNLRGVALGVVAAPLLLPGAPSIRPWPIGAGAAYRPAAAPARVRAGRPVGGYRCGAQGPFLAVHLEIFANRRAVVVPAGIGVAQPLRELGATVVPLGCSYPVRTLTPTGVVEVVRAARVRLAELFRVWGEALGKHRIGAFVSHASVRAYIDGRRVEGPLGEIALTEHEEIVLELGAYVVPHRFFLFSAPGA